MMDARTKILEAIKAANPSPPISFIGDVEGMMFENKKEQFINVLTAIGGKVIEVESMEVVQIHLNAAIAEGKKVVEILNNEITELSKQELYDVDIACIKGGVAVAENGAIWVTEKQMGNRALPFTTQQLIILIEGGNIVNNMHEAYELIDIAADGYGVFIAGPSKTADIEQSLVIGAHGPLGLLVYVFN